ncbi:hypothetical protein V5F53_12435 [Xanthobacter sp. V4C-4]|uniref:hypothetical protein n=1 Tax=Xanthobacter cornucopiae TaxID=3119924 RepID=UPI0037296893
MVRQLIRLGVVAAFSLTGMGLAFAGATGKDVLSKFNKDGDNTLEIVEVIDLGTKAFKALNADKDTTLEKGETKGRLTDADWAAVNKDGDQTLELDEWLTIVRGRFNEADTNKDGKLTEAELDAPAGQQLILLLVK